MERLDNHRILVTGAASGIGRATTLRLLAEGARVVATDVAAEGLAETAELADKAGTGQRLTTAALDVSDENAVNVVVADTVAGLGGLDALVNVAGMLRGAHTHECSLELWNQVIAVNLTGTFLVTRAALPALLETGMGVVVNFSSTSAQFAHPFMAAYSASKGGILSFTHAIAQEYGKRGLRAVNVNPGSISSGITENIFSLMPEDTDWNLMGKLTPAIGEGFGSPDTVAGVVAMLVSDDGSFITGTEIRIDGGTHQ
ncbi:SDR family NAD(P)-dependent oxidoreductase [Streptomyces sp. AS02]|uniref:SDR family NAD(P)-dependent oxidoreductase n=1 Tax=Streptomyces sp. AS02 TaxID=2938946 RepID=UPI00201FD6BE|nr:SDR family NAD(P)-dependent oxidoreductase [Streptomyces sp. AS02]MCL8014903.1 SDR family oxidoreductase [Streptomyces sp. AS02]